ncbi:MAG: DUF2764 domain-containing protein [Treponema sp.]|nr:DUF2764 domain-containing protein [Treponema sp.]
MQNRNYYYFAATLTPISYGDKPPIASEDFRKLCHSLLHPDDAALLKYCCYDPILAVETVKPTGSDFIDLLMLRERVLILNLAFVRAAKLKRQSPEDPPQDVSHAEALGKAAFEMDDPLEAAVYIDEGRWGALDDMVGLNLFGVNTIFAYLLKLQLLERRQLFDAEIGSGNYRDLYDSILNEYNAKV